MARSRLLSPAMLLFLSLCLVGFYGIWKTSQQVSSPQEPKRVNPLLIYSILLLLFGYFGLMGLWTLSA